MRITAIYDDDLAEILGRITNDLTVRRASNVEPYESLPENIKPRVQDKSPLNWWAYMIEDDYLLGPFKTREEALKAERVYLKNS